MRRTLAILILIVACYSRILAAMYEPSDWDRDFLEILFFNADLEPEDLFALSELSGAHQAFFSDSTWCLYYARLTGSTKKVRETLNYKQNCQVLNFAYSLCHTAEGCALQKDYRYLALNKIDYRELPTESTLSDKESAQLLFSMHIKPPLVFCSCFGFFQIILSSEQDMINALDVALEKDILLIFPAGNEAQVLSDQVQGYDIRKRWPHVLWVSVWNEGGPENYANYGSLLHIAAPSSSGTSNAALGILPLVIQLRRLRLDLSAAEIISILVESALKTKESLVLMPQGGIVDAEAAIAACRYYRRKT